MVFGGVILFFALILDRLMGDPKTKLHPVAVVGSFIGVWGRTNFYPKVLERFLGVCGWIVTVVLFLIPILLLELCAPWYLRVPIGILLVSFCIGWRSLEEHVKCVSEAVLKSETDGRAAVKLLVSRNVDELTDEEILSAAYESASENLVDSITAPIFWFFIFEILFGAGVLGAVLFRIANTMDAMLGYKDERKYLGWFSARMDDLLAFVPARVTGGVLLVIFGLRGRMGAAWQVFLADRKNRPGVNGGVSMSLIAGGCGVQFVKRDVYRIGLGEQSLREGGGCVLRSICEATILFSGVLILGLILI